MMNGLWAHDINTSLRPSPLQPVTGGAVSEATSSQHTSCSFPRRRLDKQMQQLRNKVRNKHGSMELPKTPSTCHNANVNQRSFLAATSSRYRLFRIVMLPLCDPPPTQHLLCPQVCPEYQTPPGMPSLFQVITPAHMHHLYRLTSNTPPSKSPSYTPL